MEQVEKAYDYNCHAPSDINEHLPLIRKYAEECRHVTEFGVRAVVSTWALVSARPDQVVCYDIHRDDNIAILESIARQAGLRVSFVCQDVLTATIDWTDLLLIDTYHTFSQLTAELTTHAHRVRKYILLHDTETFASVGEDGTQPGLWKATEEFVERESAWQILEHKTNNNGLTVLARVE